ncbi:MAG TPA: histidine kinase [Amnibacterium sp.]|jgi:signal transduction histidine kinase|uniref:sensor histidine kinase n=1 Tax=Amnibacterium sp. TaxID=1872496 RepID=UPI002F92B775
MTSTTMTTSTLPSPPTSLTRPRAGIGAAYGRFWRRMPRELAYLALTTVIGLVSLAALRGSFSSAIGVLVFAAVFVVTRYLGLFELRRQRWTGMPDIPAPQWTPPFRGKSFFRVLGDVFGNPHSWLYYLHSGILNPVLAVITTAIWLPWMVVSLAFATTPIWASTSPYGPGATLTLNHAGLVHVTGWTPAEVLIVALGGGVDPVRAAWLIAGLCALGLGMIAAFPFVTRGLTWAHWGLGRLLLARFRSEQLGAEVERVGAAQRAAVAAEDNALRRLERDIHDGPQQRLLRLQMELAAAERRLGPDAGAAAQSIEEARTLAQEALDELRALSQGFAPPLLQDRGLEAALEALARRSAVPLEADIRLTEPVPSPIERSAYFVAAELTSNAIKHAAARRIRLTVTTDPAPTSGGSAALRIVVLDDGVGGAAPVPQHGLAGAAERLAGLGGDLRIVSPAGGPTSVTATIPLPRG